MSVGRVRIEVGGKVHELTLDEAAALRRRLARAIRAGVADAEREWREQGTATRAEDHLSSK